MSFYFDLFYNTGNIIQMINLHKRQALRYEFTLNQYYRIICPFMKDWV